MLVALVLPWEARATTSLQLEVYINGRSTDLIGAFTTEDGSRLAATRKELIELGLDPDAVGGEEGVVLLEDLERVEYRYDPEMQSVHIMMPDALRKPVSHSATTVSETPPEASSSTGAAINYNVIANLDDQAVEARYGLSSVSAALDGRAFSPIGTLSQSAVVDVGTDGRALLRRLDTTHTYSDPGSLTSYRAGDIISGGFSWTRPVRLGGVQVKRNFGLRPDLVTQPGFSIGGNATVSSSVDVYINSLKTYSGTVEPGRYTIDNLPVIDGAGSALIVVTDAAGRETETAVPFFASGTLLRPGLTDFSFEAGVPRDGYATEDDSYDMELPVASASLRRGLTDWATIELHAEGGGDLANGGVGLVARTGSLGLLSMAVSGSTMEERSGFQGQVAYETKFGALSLRGSLQMTFQDYDDIGSLTHQHRQDLDSKVRDHGSDGRPARRVAQLTASMPLSFDRSNIGVSYIDRVDSSGERSSFLSGSYSRPLPWGGAFNANAFAELSGDKSFGLYAGWSFPIGDRGSVSSGIDSGPDGIETYVRADRGLGDEPGSVGWRVTAHQGRSTDLDAAVAYRSRYGRAELGASSVAGNVRATAQLDGAVATLGDGLFLTGRIDDAFAVVETGVPGVSVSYENRPVGRTDRKGRLIVPQLRSHERNKFSIDTLDLPVNAEVAESEATIAPADRSGVRVDLRVKTDTRSAIVVLADRHGQPLAVGAAGRLNGKAEFIVGYDGRAFLEGLQPTNNIVIESGAEACEATFSYAPRADAQVVISARCLRTAT